MSPARSPYLQDGRGVIFAGEAPVLELQPQQLVAGAYVDELLAGRSFAQRILARGGEVLAEAVGAAVEADGARFLRFALDGETTAGLLPAGRPYIDLQYVIVEFRGEGRDYIFEPTPFSVRRAEDAPPPASGEDSPPEVPPLPVVRFVLQPQAAGRTLLRAAKATTIVVGASRAGETRAYVHTQASASAEWVIPHNLGVRPTITVLTTGGVEMIADIVHSTDNLARAYFAQPMAGVARCL